MTALAFLASTTAVQAQSSRLFPLDRYWHHAIDAPLSAPPAADGERVYVAIATGQLIAINAETDDVVWSVELAVESAPIAADNRLFVPAAGAVHALNASTGSRLWLLPTGALAAPIVHRSGWLVVALADGALQGVRASDGNVVWARKLGSPATGAPAIDGNLLAVALADGRIAAIDLLTGTSLWERTLPAPGGGVMVSDDRIFAGTADRYFWSLKTRDGDPDWPWRIGAHYVGAAAADGERVYFIAMDNVVRAFSRGSGNLRWSHPLPTRALAGPVLIDGLLVITTGDAGAPGLTYIDARTGRAAGKTPPLPDVDETTRVQFPVEIVSGSRPLALIVTATTSGDWQLHGFRQTFLSAMPGAIVWGRRYEIIRRLDIRRGPIVWGPKITLVPPAPLVPRVPRGAQARTPGEL